jgi:cellulose synthase/poly-beta-1,6-N-acetylglucosamine synthase-like glycosyltransferase/peptidoglycan/xylan/chitin deacetylase (PgdA/CDA1 family)
MTAKPIFYDPERKRWKRLRWALNIAGVVTTLVIVFFVVRVTSSASIPQLLLPEERPAYHAVKDRKHVVRKSSHRKRPGKAASEVVLNSGDPVRAAFYVQWDAGSFSSLKEYGHLIDLLYPEFLHVLTPDGHLQGVTEDNHLFDVVQNGTIVPVDTKVMPFLRSEKLDTEVFPLVNNFDPTTKQWMTSIGQMLNDPAARERFRGQVGAFLSTDHYRGLTVDFEELPEESQPGFNALLAELGADLHAKGLKLYVSTPPHNEDFDYKKISSAVDGVIAMVYDQHYPDGPAGPLAGQDWFVDSLKQSLKLIPREKLICALANYGYDWPRKVGGTEQVDNVSVQGAWLAARDSEASVEFDSESLNPHFAYADEFNVRHDVWFTDAVTALNEMRAARQLGIQTFALWRLGSEDRSLWTVWDKPGAASPTEDLKVVPPGRDVDMDGHGEILRIEERPAPGERQVTVDPQSGIITDEKFSKLPSPYQIAQYGAKEKEVAITFDDGPDPKFTPQILDVLKREHAPATFFLIGEQADRYPGLLKRIYDEGHEIGNHTWTHPDISSISKRYMKYELNITERLLEAKLGVKTLLFRPPYSIDQEPDTDDEVRPLETMQELGYIAVGSKIDPNDWRETPHRSADVIAADVMDQLDRGNVILLHDGGGDRSETIKALPMIIDGLRERGYRIVQVSDLIGKTRSEVMPQLNANERWWAWVSNLAFTAMAGVRDTIVIIFFIGDALMTLRLFMIGALAMYDRFHRQRRSVAAEHYTPAVAVLIPAYNEEKVIVRTVRAVLASNYPNLRVIVIDDGSKDHTLEVAREAFVAEEAAGRVTILTKPNSGKAEALNYGLQYVTEDIFVGIDADTVIEKHAISRLVPHFVDERVAAVAGNAKVGNRVNLWTRWQALEYITSQNFERRALNTLNAVSVVPGAIGAWRTALVREAGGYHIDTVAEDADLTMALLRRGYRVNYEDRALAFTEAPISANGLIRQRFRWSFGILQSVWKHGEVIARKGALGWVALPNIVIFQIILPVVSPLIDIMFAFGALSYAYQRHFHPESADPSSFERLLVFFAAFLVIDFITSAIAFALERRDADAKEDVWLLGDIWVQRFTYRQLFSIVLFKTLKRAIEGRAFNWDKLERTAKMSYAGAPVEHTSKL